MYTLKATTNYHTPLNYVSYVGKGESGSVHKGMPATFKNLGNFRVTIPGAGEINLIDIGERKISKADFHKATWGVLISNLGTECEFRYEGGGEINLNVTDLGQIELSGNGRFLVTDMPSFILKQDEGGGAPVITDNTRKDRP
jgi:hypothetical protein